MTNRKNRPVLYEVIRRARQNGGSWLPRASSTVREPLRPNTDAGRVAVTAARTSEPANVSTETAPSWLSEFLEGHVRITLSYPMLAGVAVALIVLLVVSFEIGRRVGAPPHTPDLGHFDDGGIPGDASLGSEAPPSNSPRDAVHIPSKTDTSSNRVGESSDVPLTPKKGDTAAPDVAAKAKPDRPPVRQLASGMSYVQVQVFGSKDREKAEAAAQFLISKGIDCCILPRKADIVLLATQPFNLAQKDAAAKKREQTAVDGLVRKIKELGKEYAKIGGYRFEYAEPREFNK